MCACRVRERGGREGWREREREERGERERERERERESQTVDERMLIVTMCDHVTGTTVRTYPDLHLQLTNRTPAGSFDVLRKRLASTSW